LTKAIDWMSWAGKETELLNPLSDGIDHLIQQYEYPSD